MTGDDVLQSNTSKARQAARKVGIDIKPAAPRAKMVEQEETDAY